MTLEFGLTQENSSFFMFFLSFQIVDELFFCYSEKRQVIPNLSLNNDKLTCLPIRIAWHIQ